MKYLLDTDTIIYWLKGNQDIEAKACMAGLDALAYSIISHAELYFGAYNSEQVEKNLQAIQLLRQKLKLLPFDENSALIFGKTKSGLKKQGNIILDADIMIASIAQANNLTLITNNSKHFTRIPGLKIENWVNR